MNRKICPRCGVIFEVKEDPVYCSEKCKRLFQESSLAYSKGRKPESDNNSEIMRPKK